MSLLRNILMITVLLALASCGFRPVYKNYGEDATWSAELAAIEVTPLTFDRHEQVLSSELQDLLNPTSADVPAKYTLDLAVTRRRDASAIQRNRQITRYNLVVRAKYELKDKATNKVVKRGSSLMNASYDATASDFANYTAEEDSVRKIMKEIAKDIRFQLTTQFLDKKPAADKKK